MLNAFFSGLLLFLVLSGLAHGITAASTEANASLYAFRNASNSETESPVGNSIFCRLACKASLPSNLAARILQQIAALKKRCQRLDVFHQTLGPEIVQLLKPQRTGERRLLRLNASFPPRRTRVFGNEAVQPGKLERGGNGFHDVVKIVPVDGGKSTQLVLGHRRKPQIFPDGPVTREIRHNAHDKGKFLLDDGIAHFHVIGNLYARRAYPPSRFWIDSPIDTLLDAFSRRGPKKGYSLVIPSNFLMEARFSPCPSNSSSSSDSVMPPHETARFTSQGAGLCGSVRMR